MKKISAIRNIPYLTIILLTLICIMLLSSKNMIMSQASYPEATIVSSAYGAARPPARSPTQRPAQALVLRPDHMRVDAVLPQPPVGRSLSATPTPPPLFMPPPDADSSRPQR